MYSAPPQNKEWLQLVTERTPNDGVVYDGVTVLKSPQLIAPIHP
jgi:hypothetical protein